MHVQAKSRSRRFTWLVAVAVLLGAMMFWIGSSNAIAYSGLTDGHVYNVDKGMVEYASIQAAVNAASPGDTLVAAPGTYSENVIIAVEGLTLMANDGASVTTIDGGVAAIDLQVESFTLQDFTIQASEYGVNCNSIEDGDVEISGCTFEDAMHAVLFDSVSNSTIDLIGNSMATTWRGFYFSGAVSGSEIGIYDNTFDNIQANGGAYFHNIVVDSNVEIDGNSFADSSHGVQLRADIEDSTVSIANNTFNGCDDGVYVYYSTYGVFGTSELTVLDNTFEDVSDAVYIDTVDLGGKATVTGNEFDDCEYTIVVDYVSYEDPENPASLLIEENTLTDCYYAIYVDEIYYGEVVIRDNTLVDANYGIYIEYCADDGESTDVRIIDNSITATSSASSLYQGIYVYTAEDKLTISGNTISGYDSSIQYDDGIYIEYLGDYGAEPAVLEITGNTVAFCGDGIYIYEIGYDLAAQVLISGNDVSECEYGVYIDDLSSSSSTLVIAENMVEDCGVGVYLEDIYDSSGPQNIWVGNNYLAGNEHGIYVWYLALTDEDSLLAITGNDLVSNDYGLYLYSISNSDPDSILVACNNISGNSNYGILNDDSDSLLDATLNWWGDASGPDDGDNGASGDKVSSYVTFDPWIAGLILTPGDSAGNLGTERVFTATVMDSNGDAADVCLRVLFSVTGANEKSALVDLVDGAATFAYQGPYAGTDTVAAGLVFSSDAPAGLTDSSEAVWLSGANPGTDDNSPDTGDASPGYMVWILMMILALALGFKVARAGVSE